MYRGLLWVAWAVEECSRAFTRLSSRLANVEQRLDRLDAEKEFEEGADFGEELRRTKTAIDERDRDTSRRVDLHEERLRQLDHIPLTVSNLLRTVDQLSVAQRKAMDADRRPEAPKTTDREVRELRRELARTQEAVAALEARVSVESISSLAADVVARQIDRLAAELPSSPADVEGVYKELDVVAEFVAARAASTAESLERIGPLEIAVLELRRDVGRTLAELDTGQGSKDVEVRVQEAEVRLQRLEASGRRAERLLLAIEAALQPQGHAEDATIPARGARRAAGNGRGHGAAQGEPLA
jgi:hypothetical protein